jgi:hypothetical protein
MPAFVRVGSCIVPTQGLRCVLLETDPTDGTAAFLVLLYVSEKEPLKIEIVPETLDATLDMLLNVMNNTAPSVAAPVSQMMAGLSLASPPWSFNSSKDEKKTPEIPVAVWHNRA